MTWTDASTATVVIALTWAGFLSFAALLPRVRPDGAKLREVLFSGKALDLMYALAAWSVLPFLLLVLESLISDLGLELVTEMSRILYVIWLLGVPLSTVLLVLFDASKIGKWSIGYMDRRIERDLVRHLRSGTLKRDVTNHLIEIVWRRARFDCNRESAAVLERLRTRKDELGRIVDDTVGLLDDSLAQGRASEKPERRALRPLLAVQALLLALVMLVSWGIATGW